MIKHAFCDTCEGCRPCLLNPETGKVLGPDDPTMIRVNNVWDHDTTYAERKAFIEVCMPHPDSPVEIVGERLAGERNAERVQLANQVIEKIKLAMDSA